MSATSFQPDWYSPPGSTIRDLLCARGESVDQFAARVGWTPERAEALIEGEERIDRPVANMLSTGLGASTEFWLNRENQFRADFKRFNESAWLKALPITDMTKLGWIRPVPRRIQDRLRECLAFFDVSSPSEWNTKYGSRLTRGVAYRTSVAFANEDGALSAWLRQGELLAKRRTGVSTFSETAFLSVLEQIRALTREKKPDVFLPKLEALCASAGVVFVLLRAPKGCRVSGATYRLGERYVIQQSFRHLSDDHFWFTFFHEAGHVVLHRGRGLIVDGSDSTSVGHLSDTDEEQANEFAATTLIPADARQRLRSLPLTERNLVRFARDIGISPGIVVGQLEHAGRISHRQFAKLKRRFKWIEN